MKAHYLYVVPAVLLAACSTVQENPNYQYSSKYGQAETDFASSEYGSTAHTHAASHNAGTVRTASNAASAPIQAISLEEYCMQKNRQRELIGAGIGGTLGAIAGDAIGGTKATIAGAAIGGTVGYAAGDNSLDCQTVTRSAPMQVPASTGYGHSPSSSYPASVPTRSVSPTDEAYNADQMMGTPGYQLFLQEQAAAMPVGQSAPSPTVSHHGTQGYGHASPPAGQSYREYHSHNQGQSYQSAGNAPRPPAGSSRAVDYDYSDNTVTAGGPVGSSYSSQPVRPPAAGHSGGYSGQHSHVQPPHAQSPHAQPHSHGVRAPVPASHRGQGNYIVRQGDTVYSLSRSRCIPVNEFSRINGLDANYSIKIDQSLILPPSRC